MSLALRRLHELEEADGHVHGRLGRCCRQSVPLGELLHPWLLCLQNKGVTVTASGSFPLRPLPGPAQAGCQGDNASRCRNGQHYEHPRDRIPVPHFPCRPSGRGGDMAACEGGGREGLSSWRGSTHCHQGLCLHLTQAQAGWPVCHPDQHPTDARTKARPRRAGAGSLRGGPAPCSGNSGHHTLHLDKLLLSFQGSA